MSQAEVAKGLKVLATLSKQFVPEDGITRAVLEDNFHLYFPKGARLDRKIQLTPGGPPGWFIAGGMVTDSIIEALRRDTLRETDPSSYRSFRDAELACEEAVTSKHTREGLNSFLNDRHRAPYFPPQRSSLSSPDEKPAFYPTENRHQQIDSDGLPQQKIVSFADPATAVRCPRPGQRTEEDFADFQAWKEYLLLKGEWSNGNRHQNDTASSVVPPRTPHQPSRVTASPSHRQSGGDAGGRIKDVSAPLDNSPAPCRHARQNENDDNSDDEPPRRRRPAARHRRCYDDLDSDSGSDYYSDRSIKRVVRTTPWSRTVTTTRPGRGVYRSRR